MFRLLGNRTNSNRLWSLVVNHIAAAGFITHPQRTALYRLAGIVLETEQIRPGTFIFSTQLQVGPGSMVNSGCYIENREPVAIGANCFLGMQVLIGTSTHQMGGPEQRAGEYVGRSVTIADGCWIGARATILPGVAIAAGCIIAAGAVVVADTEPDGLYGGVPAKRIRDL